MRGKITGFLLAAALLFLLAGCSSAGKVAEGVVADKSLPVEVLTVQREQVAGIVVASGTVRPASQVTLQFQVPGAIARLPVAEGDSVKAGQVVAALEDSDYRAQSALAAGQLTVAESQYQKASIGARPEEIRAAEARSSQAQAALENALANLERVKRLYMDGAVPQQKLEEVETMYKVAAEQAVEAAQGLALARQGAREEDIKAAEGGLVQARAGLDLARSRVDKTVLRSPISGVVLKKLAEAGELTGPGTPVAVLGRLDGVLVETGLPDVQATALQTGTTARAVFDAFPKQVFQGRVSEIGALADPGSRTFSVKVELDNPDLLLKPGMVGTVEIPTASREVLLVPFQAVISKDDGTRAVFLLDDSGRQVHEQPVTIGRLEGDRVEIIWGIADGARVVVAGGHYLVDGQPVHVVGGERP